MTTEKQIYAEIRNTFKSYDEAGLVDEISLRGWLRTELKRFGTNVMVNTQDILKVKQGKAELPKDFWSLQEVWRYHASHYKTEAVEIQRDSHFRTEIASNFECDNGEFGNNCLMENYDTKYGSVALYYNNPQILRIKPGFSRSSVTKDCVNLPNKVQKINGNQVEKQGNFLSVEFTDGHLFVVYKALPTDEDGYLLIPETQHDSLSEYLTRNLEYRFLRSLVLNEDAPNLGSRLQLLKQESDDAFSLAMTESKASVLDPSVWKSIVQMNRKRYRRFENLTPAQNLNRRNH